MRRMTSSISSALCLDSTMRSTVWQLTHPLRAARCSLVPGTLVIHSRFDSCAARFLVLTSFTATVAGVAAERVTDAGPARSHPLALTLSVYSPGGSLDAGKLNSPFSLLTTLT